MDARVDWRRVPPRQLAFALGQQLRGCHVLGSPVQVLWVEVGGRSPRVRIVGREDGRGTALGVQVEWRARELCVGLRVGAVTVWVGDAWLRGALMVGFLRRREVLGLWLEPGPRLRSPSRTGHREAMVTPPSPHPLLVGVCT